MTTKDITKIKEVTTKDDGDWEEWPYPTVEITSKITGELREKILNLTAHQFDGDITLVEEKVSSGYSEYTQEDEHSIRVLIGDRQVWTEAYESSQESAMAKFLRWVQ
jgi:hypothetical protein